MHIYKISFDYDNGENSYTHTVYFAVKPTKRDILAHLSSKDRYEVEHLEEFTVAAKVFPWDASWNKGNNSYGQFTIGRVYILAEKISVKNNRKGK